MAPGAPHHKRYVILGEAGKGGLAVVHIARDLELIRKVARKRLAGSAAMHEDVQARFPLEVQISAQLDHPSLAPVSGLEVGPDGVLSQGAASENGALCRLRPPLMLPIVGPHPSSPALPHDVSQAWLE